MILKTVHMNSFVNEKEECAVWTMVAVTLHVEASVVLGTRGMFRSMVDRRPS